MMLGMQDPTPMRPWPTQPVAELLGPGLSKHLSHLSIVSSRGQGPCSPHCCIPGPAQGLCPQADLHMSPVTTLGPPGTPAGPHYLSFTIILRVEILSHITDEKTETPKLN